MADRTDNVRLIIYELVGGKQNVLGIEYLNRTLIEANYQLETPQNLDSIYKDELLSQIAGILRNSYRGKLVLHVTVPSNRQIDEIADRAQLSGVSPAAGKTPDHVQYDRAEFSKSDQLDILRKELPEYVTGLKQDIGAEDETEGPEAAIARHLDTVRLVFKNARIHHLGVLNARANLGREVTEYVRQKIDQIIQQHGLTLSPSEIKLSIRGQRELSVFKITLNTDSAMTVYNGGIDLDTANVNWKIGKDGKGVEINVDRAMIERIKRNGIDRLTPVIFRVTPITSVWPLVGLQPPRKEDQLAGV
ncbi:MAG: hypothetical protein HY591_06105 [Candidatus Omnitrophica bacterium]|nr:hypothetical protein [Candidatus Omnitrophota bacterium]